MFLLIKQIKDLIFHIRRIDELEKVHRTVKDGEIKTLIYTPQEMLLGYKVWYFFRVAIIHMVY